MVPPVVEAPPGVAVGGSLGLCQRLVGAGAEAPRRTGESPRVVETSRVTADKQLVMVCNKLIMMIGDG